MDPTHFARQRQERPGDEESGVTAQGGGGAVGEEEQEEGDVAGKYLRQAVQLAPHVGQAWTALAAHEHACAGKSRAYRYRA